MKESLKTLILAGVLVGAVTVAAQADPSFTSTVFGPNSPDSITTGAGSVWVSYDGGTNSDGTVPGTFSTVFRYSTTGQVEATFKIEGDVDGLKYNSFDNTVWALQNQDANSRLSIIDPKTNGVTQETYAVVSSTQGYDDVVFYKKNVTFLSYTNPSAPTDSVLNQIVPNTSPIQVKSLLTAGAPGQGGVVLTTANTDSLKVAPNGDLVQTTGNRDTLAFIHKPGTASQSVSYLTLSASGKSVTGLDDTLFPNASAGTLYATVTNPATSAATSGNEVLALTVSGLAPNTMLASIGSLNEIAIVNLTTGNLTPFATGLSGVHGLAFVADPIPEPGSLTLLAIGLVSLTGLLSLTSLRRRLSSSARV
jgi:hypothetical protein